MNDSDNMPSGQEEYENKTFKKMLAVGAVGLTALQTYPMGSIAMTLGYGYVNIWSAYVLHIGYKFGGKLAESLSVDNPWESQTGSVNHFLAGTESELPRVRNRHIGQIVGLGLAALVVRACNGPDPYDDLNEAHRKRQQKTENTSHRHASLKENATSVFAAHTLAFPIRAQVKDTLAVN